MSIQLFDFRGNDVRVVVNEAGEPEWVATDVAKVLGYRDASNMCRRLEEDEAGTRSVNIRSANGVEQDRTVTTITESGLYTAILGSKRPEARDFKRWVTRDVLPAIRKHGAYLTPSKIEEVLTDPDTIIKIATELKNERTQRQALEAQAEADRPKVLFADAVSTSKSEILVGDLAKILRGNGIPVGGKRLFAWLRANGFLISQKGTGWNSPTQRAMELGLFKVKETTVVHSDGHTTINKTPKVTGKGQAYFVSRFLDGRFTVTDLGAGESA